MAGGAPIQLSVARGLPWNSGNDLVLEMGDGEAQLTQGFGGWEAIGRPQRIAITRYTGTEPLGQDIPIIFEKRPFPQAPDIQGPIDALISNARPKPDGYPPTVYRIQGPVWFTEKRWIIADIEWGDQQRASNGQIIRQRAVLKMLEFVNPDAIKVRKRPIRVVFKPKGKGTKDRKVKTDGKTNLRQIAKKYYGTAKVAKELGKRQKPPIRDVKKKLKKGQTIKLPNFVWDGKNFKTVWPNLTQVTTGKGDGGFRP